MAKKISEPFRLNYYSVFSEMAQIIWSFLFRHTPLLLWTNVLFEWPLSIAKEVSKEKHSFTEIFNSILSNKGMQNYIIRIQPSIITMVCILLPRVVEYIGYLSTFRQSSVNADNNERSAMAVQHNMVFVFCLPFGIGYWDDFAAFVSSFLWVHHHPNLKKNQ